MTFLEPGRLMLLVLPMLAVGAYLWSLSRREQYAVRFTNLELLDKVAPEKPGWRRHVPAAALLMGMVAMVLAVAKPATAVQVARQEATVILTVDISLSMEASDVEPTRIEAARQAARSFLELAPEDLRVGIVGFSGQAVPVLSPTTDRSLANLAIDRLELGEGTAIGEGIFAAVALGEATQNADRRFALNNPDEAPAPQPSEDGELEEPPVVIVVLSDGETTVGRPDLDAADAAAEAGFPISTISFGTALGEVFIQGETIPVPANEGALRDVAAATGGEFFEAATAEELGSILESVGSELAVAEETREVTDWFVGAGLLMTLLAAAGSLLWFSRMP